MTNISVFFVVLQLLYAVSGQGANFPLTPDGATYHLEIHAGDVAQRVLVVGDLKRARLYADLYLNHTMVDILSERGFLTITGTYKGVNVSIIGTGMGTPMIDFTIRETRAMTNGTMAFIRVGTCGSPSADVLLGDIVVVNASRYLHRNPDQFNYPVQGEPHYLMSRPVSSDQRLTDLLGSILLTEKWCKKTVHFGDDVTTDSFYASQGRILSDFADYNEDVITGIMPSDTAAIQMETFHLFDLARSSNPGRKIIAAADCLVVAQRFTDKFIDQDLKEEREKLLGRSAMEALFLMDVSR